MFEFQIGRSSDVFGGNAVGFVVVEEVFGCLTLGGAIVVRWPLSVVPALSIGCAIVYVFLYGSTSELCMLRIT